MVYSSSSSTAATAVANNDNEMMPPTALSAAEVEEHQQSQQQHVVFNLNIFETLDQAQSLHGIPLQDYTQYYEYCCKRLHRLSHHKDVRNILTHSSKYAESSGNANTKMRRHAYCPRNLSPNVVQHEYVFWNLLFQAERAWARACAAQKEDSSASSRLKNKKNSNNNNTSRKHNHVRRKLNKAVKWAIQFVTLIQKQQQDSTTAIQEAQAYLSWMQANAYLECKQYANAYRNYQTSRQILLQLANNNVDNKTNDSAAVNPLAITSSSNSDLWTRWAESILKPLVRYCLHEARDTLDPAEVALLSSNEAVSSQSGTSSSKSKSNKENDSIRLEFRNQEITLDAYPQLAVLYLKMEEHLLSSNNDGADEDEKQKKPPLDETEFLQLLTDLDDATSLTMTEAAKYARLASSSSSSSTGPAVHTKRKELATLKSFFNHHKLQLQRQRQEERVLPTLQDVGEIVHVYDALLQNAQSMVDLHSSTTGKGDDDDNEQHTQPALVDEDDPYWLEAQAHLVRIRAFRCFHLARLYESMPTTTSAQVAALLQQASLLQQRAVEEVAACEMDDRYLDALQVLQKDIQIMTCRIEATRFLEIMQASGSGGLGGGSIGKTTDRPLWLRLDDLDAGKFGVLADQPPLFIPIPYKPVFYDLAFDHVIEHGNGLQTLQNYIQEHGGGGDSKEEEGKSISSGGGIFGWFSGK